MRCTQCGWPQSEAHTISTHHTSEGWVRYKRCTCGSVSIELLTLEEPARDLHAARA